MPAAENTVKEVSPVWVFVVLDTHFDRLLQLVSDRRRDLRLFYRVNSDGRLLDDELVERLLDAPASFKNPVRTPCQVKREARMNNKPDPAFRSSSPQEQLPLVYGLNVDSLLAALTLDP